MESIPSVASLPLIRSNALSQGSATPEAGMQATSRMGSRQSTELEPYCVETAYLRELAPIGLLSYEDEQCLARASRTGDGYSRWQMIRHNLRLVLGLARRYRNRGVSLLDMVEEGNIGLMRAVDKYDPERGCRFSTYATWWVRQSIERAIMNQARDVRLPVHIIKEVSQCLRQQNELAQILGRWPTRTELAEACQRDVDELESLLACHESSYDKLEYLPDPDELESDGLQSAVCDDPASHVHQRSLNTTLYNWLQDLSRRQRQILIYRFGLLGQPALTLEEVGEKVGITRERVRQIQLEAMGHLQRFADRRGYDISAFF